ncbi:hypothetical protein IWW38_005345, partial [Coemansia aciculifera]
MADSLIVTVKSGDYIMTYHVESKVSSQKEFVEALKTQLPVLVKDHNFELVEGSFEPDCIQYLSEWVYQFS